MAQKNMWKTMNDKANGVPSLQLVNLGKRPCISLLLLLWQITTHLEFCFCRSEVWHSVAEFSAQGLSTGLKSRHQEALRKKQTPSKCVQFGGRIQFPVIGELSLLFLDFGPLLQAISGALSSFYAFNLSDLPFCFISLPLRVLVITVAPPGLSRIISLFVP